MLRCIHTACEGWFTPCVAGDANAHAAALWRDPCQVARLSLGGILGDMRNSMMEEVDFEKESEHYQQFATFLDTKGYRTIATSPYIYKQLSSKRCGRSRARLQVHVRARVCLNGVLLWLGPHEASGVCGAPAWVVRVQGTMSRAGARQGGTWGRGGGVVAVTDGGAGSAAKGHDALALSGKGVRHGRPTKCTPRHPRAQARPPNHE